MELNFAWVLLPGALLVAAAIAAGLFRRRRRAASTIPVAHGERLTALPGYRRLLLQHRIWLGVVAASALLLAVSLLFAAARPVLTSSVRPEQRSRDIMLCLDVSGSMSGADAAIARVFSEMAEEFHGERLGLTIFDSSSVQAFPLTDDYDYVQEQLERARNAFDHAPGTDEFFDGVWEGPGSSVIGDGLASCVQNFPRLGEEDRSRSIVLSTDNYAIGRSIFTLQEAANLASEGEVRVFALNPADYGGADPDGEAEELRIAVESTGGRYFPLRSASAAGSIIGQVQASEATVTRGSARGTIADRPELPLGIALVAGAFLALGLWRLRP